MIISCWWLSKISKLDGKKFEDIHWNIGTLKIRFKFGISFNKGIRVRVRVGSELAKNYTEISDEIVSSIFLFFAIVCLVVYRYRLYKDPSQPDLASVSIETLLTSTTMTTIEPPQQIYREIISLLQAYLTY